MGSIFSKDSKDSVNTENIESDVFELWVKIKDEEENVDKYVKSQIIDALQNYLKQVEPVPRRNISAKKLFQIKDSISRAIKQLEKLPIKNYDPMKNITTGEDVDTLKQFMFNLLEDVEHNRIEESQYPNILEMLTAYSCKLYGFPSNGMNKEQRQKVSMLFLKIYVRCPKTKASTILEENLDFLNNIIKNFERFDFINVSPFNAAETKKALLEIKSKTQVINQLCQEGIAKMNRKGGKETRSNTHGYQHSQHHSYSNRKSKLNNEANIQERSNKSHKVQQCHNLLDHLDDGLTECDEMVQRLCPPIGNDVLAKLTKRINNLIKDQLNLIKEENEEIAQRKNILHTKGSSVLSKLQSVDETTKTINETFKTLQKIEDEVFQIASSPIDFAGKRKSLETQKEKLHAVSNNYSEISERKKEILNTIEGIVIFEISNNLRQLTKTVKQEKLYAEQFPFPRYVTNYVFKCKELETLRKRLEEFPKEYVYMSTLVRSLNEEVCNVSVILKERATYNEQVISALNNLESIRKGVMEINHSHSTNLLSIFQLFIQFRHQLEKVDDSLGNKVIAKKMEIRRLLQNIEAKILPNTAQVFQELKIKLNEYENQALCFAFSVSSDVYYQKLNEIKCFVKKVIENYTREDPTVVVICNTANLILYLLENMARQNGEMSEYSLYLNGMEQSLISYQELSFEKKIEFLEKSQNSLHTSKKYIRGLEILNKITDLETKLAFEKSKLGIVFRRTELKTMKDSLNSPQGARTQDDFKAIVDKLFFLKSCIEDMPQGDPDLDSQKQKFSEELFKCLESVDATLAGYVVTVKQPKSILELKSHFNFDVDSLKIPRDSVEFVRIIRQRATTYEDSVKFYLGTNYSVDYYVIHENLLRLLEELDKVVCGDDANMLGEIVEVMDYTKNLIRQLDANATEE